MEVHWDVFQHHFLKDVSARYISVETLSAVAFIKLREKHDLGKVTEWRQNQMKKYAHNVAWNSQHFFFHHYFPWAKSISVLSFQYFTSLIYLSPCSLWCEIPFIFLMFRGWKCAEHGPEISPVVRQHHGPGRWDDEQVEGASLLRWDNSFCAAPLQALLNCMKKGCGNVRWVLQIF